MFFPATLQNIPVGTSALSLFVPNEVAVQQAYKKGKLTDPYWSRVWPSAMALALFLQKNTHFIYRKKVVELGAGLGLPSLAAAPFAASVWCTDKEIGAIDCVQKSAAHHQYTNVQAKTFDWMKETLPEDIDVLLLSDLNYEPQVFHRLHTIIHEVMQKGTAVILSTPQRLMAKDFILPLLPLCKQQEVIDVRCGQKIVTISVLLLQLNGLVP